MTPATRPLQRLRRIERVARIIDIAVAGVGLALLTIPIALLALLVKVTSAGPAFFVQRRVGRDGRVFGLVKLRTMVVGAASSGPLITGRHDRRLTRLGRWLRRTKLDELPQLWNVLRGDMSLVGPRPELEPIVERFADQYSVLLLVRPGLTSEATLRYRDEEQELPAGDPETFYLEKVLPEKIRMERDWLAHRSVLSDLEILLRTVLLVLGLRWRCEPIRFRVSRREWLCAKGLVDACVAAAAWLLATLLRFDGLPDGEDLSRLEWLALPVVVVTVFSLQAGGMIQGIWRFFSSRDAVHLVLLGLPVAGLLTLLRVLAPDSLSLLRTPYSVTAMTYVLSIAGQCGVRLAWSRIVSLRQRRRHPHPELSGRVVIYGAGATGRRVLTELRRVAGRRTDVLAFFDDNPFKRGTRLSGVPVAGGARELPAFLEHERPDLLLIAIASLPEERLRPVVEHARLAGVCVKIVPSLIERLGRPTAGTLRDLEIADLIGRSPVRLDPHDRDVAAAYRGKIVLVTGAGGSIGSELVRQLVPLEPRALVLLDKDENTLFRLDRELQDVAPKLEHVPVIGDIRHHRDLADLFRRLCPQVVLHAAAYKHVPLMEANELEAISNNVFGTRNLVRLAASSEVESFVFISTDKAVRPSSVMGASKRVGELIVRAMEGPRRTRFSVVRFGNVLGSQGSVVETFLHQIRSGGPLTVTHPDVERYFLAVAEAVQLVLVAGALPEPKGCYVLQMGRPRRIVDLARDMIRLYASDAGTSIPIVFTGLRPGEKLTEELCVTGTLDPVAGQGGIDVDAEPRPSSDALDSLLLGLRRALRRRDREGVRELLRLPPVGLACAPPATAHAGFKPPCPSAGLTAERRERKSAG
ncbi:MAG: polysaccharide biosynthesis protein [Planctomycetota bacterium]